MNKQGSSSRGTARPGRRGFIGPIGDDLPSIVAIMLALGLFFSGVLFALNAYNQKLASLDLLKGGLEVSRVVLADGLVLKPLSEYEKLGSNADLAAKSYGLAFKLGFDKKSSSCGKNSFVMSYFVFTGPSSSFPCLLPFPA